MNAVSLTLAAKRSIVLPSLGEVAGIAVRKVIEEIASMHRNPSETINTYRRWTAHSVGESIRCLTGRGARSGTFVGFDQRGFLRLATSEGEITVSGGEIVEPAMAAGGVREW